MLFSVAITLVLGLLIVQSEDNDSQYGQPITLVPSNEDIRINSQEILFKLLTKGPKSINRKEVLKQNVIGYREQTYWGNEHPIDQRIEDLNDKEFSDFIEEEVISKDIDIYWGAEY